MSEAAPAPAFTTAANMALLTDLYELTMAASYFEHGMTDGATFELSIRSLPPQRNFLIAAGVADALAYLEGVRFDLAGIDYLRSLGMFSERFLTYLGGFRFTGEVWAIPEGEAVFASEPLLRITAPLIEAQFAETFLMNCVSFQTMVASKAARIAIACQGREFVDFSPRRDHGADAALKGARAAFLGGAAATSNVLAGQVYGIPVSGTMAHSYVMSFERELDAFRRYAEDFPRRATLLLDTYDTLEGAQNAVIVGREMAARGEQLHGVRLDSGDLGELARDVRAVVDKAGLEATQIFASGDLDEHRIRALLEQGAPIDAFGVGTQLGTSADAPTLGAIYKLVENEAGPRMKRSAGKATLPGRKQVYRFDEAGRLERDVIALADEPGIGGRPLLQQVMAGGCRTESPEPLGELRARCAATLSQLPERLRALDGEPAEYRVDLSDGLRGLLQAESSSLRGGA